MLGSTCYFQKDGLDTNESGSNRLAPLLGALPAVFAGSPQMVFLEDYFVNPDYPNGIDLNIEVRGLVKAHTRPPIDCVHEYYPQTWKAGIGLPGDESRKDKIRAHVEERIGQPLPAKVLSPATGRMIKVPSDVSDAIGIGLYGLSRYGVRVERPQLAVCGVAAA